MHLPLLSDMHLPLLTADLICRVVDYDVVSFRNRAHVQSCRCADMCRGVIF